MGVREGALAVCLGLLLTMPGCITPNAPAIGSSGGSGDCADAVPTVGTSPAGTDLWRQSLQGASHGDPSEWTHSPLVTTSPLGDRVYVATRSEPMGTRGPPPGNEHPLLPLHVAAYRAVDGEEVWVTATTVEWSAPRDIVVSPDGCRIVVVGSVQPGPAFAVLALDARTGAEEWLLAPPAGELTYGDAYAAAVSGDGSHVFVTGQRYGNATTLALDAESGEIEWLAEAGRGNVTWAMRISPEGDRAYAVGSTLGDDRFVDFLVLAFDATDGRRLWAAALPIEDGGADVAHAVDVSPDGARVFVAGVKRATGDDQRSRVVALDADSGSVAWDVTLNESEMMSFVRVAPDGSRVFAIGTGAGADGTDAFTYALRPDTGERVWTATHHTEMESRDSIASSLHVGTSGAVYVGAISVPQERNGFTLDLTSERGILAYDGESGELQWADHDEVNRSGMISGRVWAGPGGAQVYLVGSDYGHPSWTSERIVTTAYAARPLDGKG